MLKKKWIAGLSLTGVLVLSGSAFALASGTPAGQMLGQALGSKPAVSSTVSESQPASTQLPVNQTVNPSRSQAAAPSTESNNLPSNSSPLDRQYLMNSEIMQSMHNSTAMQEAMKTGDITKMREAMNSPEIKAQLGEDVVNQMNQMMSDANIKAMHGGQSGTMMSGQGGSMMGSGSGTNGMMYR